MNTAEQTTYFKNIAERNKTILHTASVKRFCRMNIEEVITGLRSTLDPGGLWLILEHHEGRVMDALSDNVQEDQRCAFMVLKTLSSRDDFDAQDTALDDCNETGWDIITWIRKDRRNRVLKALDLNSVSYQKVGPVFDNAYGYRFVLGLKKPKNLSFDDAKWNL